MHRLLVAVAVLLTVLFSAAALAFDDKPSKIDISNMYATYSYVVINTYGTAIGVSKAVDSESNTRAIHTIKRKTSFLLRGVGFVIKEGYIVTAAHVVHPAAVRTMGNYDYIVTEVPIKVLSRQIVISPDTDLAMISGGKIGRAHV